MTDITNQKHRLLTRGSPHDRHDACDMLDALAKERDELRAEVERLRAVLSEYKDSLCEGFCGEDQWADAGHCHPDFQRDCGGCKAACALQRKEGDG